MKILIVAIATTFAFVFGGPWQAPESANKIQNPRANDKRAASEGEDLYLSYCWSCHGENGSGKGPAASSLETAPADLHSLTVQKQTDGALYWKMSNGRNDMAPYESVLTTDQRWALVNYIRTLSGS